MGSRGSGCSSGSGGGRGSSQESEEERRRREPEERSDRISEAKDFDGLQSALSQRLRNAAISDDVDSR